MRYRVEEKDYGTHVRYIVVDRDGSIVESSDYRDEANAMAEAANETEDQWQAWRAVQKYLARTRSTS